MKLDRNVNDDGKGKYSLINNRTGETQHGDTPEDEFFVIKLKDKYAQAALVSYANAAAQDDTEYANEVMEMATRSGPAHPLCKMPD
jgi:hypothetical protein